MNLRAEQTRAQLVLIAGRIQSAQETLRSLLQQEPRLTAYLDTVARSLKSTAWEIRMAGENVDLLYAKVWPPVALDFPVSEPPLTGSPVVRSIGHVHISPLDAGYPRGKRTGRPKASWEESDA